MCSQHSRTHRSGYAIKAFPNSFKNADETLIGLIATNMYALTPDSLTFDVDYLGCGLTQDLCKLLRAPSDSLLRCSMLTKGKYFHEPIRFEDVQKLTNVSLRTN